MRFFLSIVLGGLLPIAAGAATASATALAEKNLAGLWRYEDRSQPGRKVTTDLLILPSQIENFYTVRAAQDRPLDLIGVSIRAEGSVSFLTFRTADRSDASEGFIGRQYHSVLSWKNNVIELGAARYDGKEIKADKSRKEPLGVLTRLSDP